MRPLMQIAISLTYLIVLIIPGYAYFSSPSTTKLLFLIDNDPATRLLVLFRLFGLYGFTLLWTQVMLGSFRIPLTRLFGARILKLHISTGIFTLCFVTLHPLLFYVANSLQGTSVLVALYNYLGSAQYIYGLLGVTGFCVMLATITAALLRTRPFMQKWWRKIHYFNYVLFVLIFLHSFHIGSTVQHPAMRLLYWFFAITYLAGLSYRRLIPWIKKRIQVSTHPVAARSISKPSENV